VCAVELGASSAPLVRALRARFDEAEVKAAESERFVRALVRAADTGIPPSVPLDLSITAFQARVYRALQRIPPGETRTYEEVARAIGRPTAARAVARACATNPVAIAVPCHRVVRADGGLAGYRWGTKRKRALLDVERARFSKR
jgi:AraC family transcriptional regulator of adaptative response/methylated-DNA-[protein]-cysteine methyltransferase